MVPIKNTPIVTCIILGICNCFSGREDIVSDPTPDEKTAIPISKTVASRDNEYVFESGDTIGLYVADRFPASAVYWTDQKTLSVFYLYYPYTHDVSSVEAITIK